jgi:hypothetical protein
VDLAEQGIPDGAPAGEQTIAPKNVRVGGGPRAAQSGLTATGLKSSGASHLSLGGPYRFY